MKKSIAFMLAAAVLVTASYAEAAKKQRKYRPRLLGPLKLVSQVALPAPAPASEPIPAAKGAPAPSVHDVAPAISSAPVELFKCVEVDDRHNIHPCAVPKIVSIVDPCACDDPCSCCGPKCVNVLICVPPCGCPEVKVSRNGYKVKYDYGEYEIEIKSSKRKGIIEVDYDD